MNDSKQQENSQGQGSAATTKRAAVELPGRRLRETRENMHLGREEVAHHLRLDVQLVTALEQDDYSTLPSPTYIRGYLRSYARLLKLPEDEIVQAYGHGEQTDVELIPSCVNMPTQKPVNTALLKTIVGVVLVILVGGGIYFVIDKLDIFSGKSSSKHVVAIQDHGTVTVPLHAKTEPDNTKTPVHVASKPQASAPANATQQKSMQQKAAPVKAPVKAAAGKTTVEKLPTPKSKIPASEPDVPAAPATKTSGATASPSNIAQAPTNVAQANNASGATAVLRMHFTDNSWVEVTDSTNKSLVYRLVEKDSNLNLVGVPPFTILLGNAPAVQVFYKGKEFDHSNYHRNQVANFKIGTKQTNTDQ